MNGKSGRNAGTKSLQAAENWVLILHNVATREANRKSRVIQGDERGNRGVWAGGEGCSQVESSRSIDFIALGWLYPVSDPRNEHIPSDKPQEWRSRTKWRLHPKWMRPIFRIGSHMAYQLIHASESFTVTYPIRKMERLAPFGFLESGYVACNF